MFESSALAVDQLGRLLTEIFPIDKLPRTKHAVIPTLLGFRHLLETELEWIDTSENTTTHWIRMIDIVQSRLIDQGIPQISFLDIAWFGSSHSSFGGLIFDLEDAKDDVRMVQSARFAEGITAMLREVADMAVREAMKDTVRQSEAVKISNNASS